MLTFSIPCADEEMEAFAENMHRPALRLLITAVIVCHWLLSATPLTSQLHPASPGATSPPKVNVGCLAALIQRQADDQPAAPAGPQFSLPPGVQRETIGTTEDVVVSADHQEKQGENYHLQGHVQINFRTYQLNADDVTVNRDSGAVTATGHVILVGGPHDERIRAESANYNLQTDSGTLRHVVATVGIAVRSGRMVLTSPSPLAFSGDMVQRNGPERFVAYGGSITTCDIDHPTWTFNAAVVTVDLGATAKLYNGTFRLQRVPIFYLPFVARPVETLGRQTGFLLPSVGQSSSKGTILSESFFWAINRSADATIGAEYFSRRGWAQRGEFRARPTQNSNIDVRYFGVFDRGILVNGVKNDQGGEEVNATADSPLPLGFRGVADLDYLSTYVFRLAFAESFTQAVNSEVKSTAFASRDFNGIFLNFAGSRYQNFQSTTRGDSVTILHTPSIESSADEMQLGSTRLFWSYEIAGEGVSRREPGFVTSALAGRFDFEPSLALPLVAHGWSIRPEIALRDTYYSERVLPNGVLGTLSQDPLDRRALEARVELRAPAISRVFEKPFFGRKLKHTIETHVVYDFVSGINNFQNVIRFDIRDLFSNTNEVEYGITNRIFARRLAPQQHCNPQSPTGQTTGEATGAAVNAGDVLGGTAEPSTDQTGAYQPGPKISPKPVCDAEGSVRQVLTWQLAQKAFFDPTFGGAVVNGKRNVLTTTAELSGIAFLTEPRNLSPIISRLRWLPSDATDLQWNLDYDVRKGRISGSTIFATWRMDEFFIGGSHAFFHAPGEIFVTNPIPGPTLFNQFRVIGGYGHPNKHGLSLAGSLGFDSNFSKVQYGTGQISYNWDCIGLSVEYRRFALGPVRPNENQIRFSLSLANIGTFGNLRRQERLF
jgi:LPS-assembly protein